MLSLLAAAAAFSHLTGCERRCPPPVEKQGWVYSASPVRGRCDYGLAWRGQEVTAQFTLVTPFGTLMQVGPEERGDDSGWQVIDERSSGDIPYAAAAIPASVADAGFYPSDGASRLRGTPESWVYVTDVRTPGWAAPERLFDRAFIESQPWTPRVNSEPSRRVSSA